jgi:hypothetical protein
MNEIGWTLISLGCATVVSAMAYLEYSFRRRVAEITRRNLEAERRERAHVQRELDNVVSIARRRGNG